MASVNGNASPFRPKCEYMFENIIVIVLISSLLKFIFLSNLKFNLSIVHRDRDRSTKKVPGGT